MQTRLRIGFSLLAIVTLSCKGGGDDTKPSNTKTPAGKPATAKAPAKPSDGTPVSAQFVSMTGSDSKLAAKMTFYNHTAKPIHVLRMRLHYLDAAGKELKTFPWSQTASPLITANGNVTKEVGMMIPAETKSVKAVFRKVEFGDGTNWERANAK